MSANATSLRRILRSIGSHETPSSQGARSSNLASPRTHSRAVSQILGRTVQRHGAPQHGRRFCASHRRLEEEGLKPALDQAENDGGKGALGHGDSVHAQDQHATIRNRKSRTAKQTGQLDGHVQDQHATVRKRVAKAPSLSPKRMEQTQRMQRKFADHNKPSKSSDNMGLRPEDEGGFGERYLLKNLAKDNDEMKKQARRLQLLRKRHDHSDERAWPEILRVLEEDGPKGEKHYTKRMETIRLPEGIFARWMRDPGESILEVMQRTGSHVQVVPAKELGLFSSLTLLGLPFQNAAAKRLLQESDLLGAVSQDDLNASKSLADYQLRSEVSDRHGKALQEDNVEESEMPSDDLFDEIDLGELENAVGNVTGNAPTGASWSTASAGLDTKSAAKQSPGALAPENAPTRAVWSNDFAGLNTKGAAKQSQGALATETSTFTDAITFTNRIDDLIASMPIQKWRKSGEYLDYTSHVRTKLVALLTNHEHSHLITPLAAGNALGFLARHMHFPAVRQILNLLKDTKLQLSAEMFNNLLAAAAQSENVLAFHHIVHAMRKRGVFPNASTWVHFHVLMMKRFPAEADKVITRMRSKAVQADLSARIDNVETYSAILLVSFIESHPGASIKDFVRKMSDDMPGVRWLTCFAANKMCFHLLKNGEITMAFEVVDELVRSGGRPDTVTLNTFLSTAHKHRDMEMAVTFLRKLHDLHANSTPLAGTLDDQLSALPRTHDLSIAFNFKSFKLLCSLAWDRKHFNCLRMFWRYACCVGHVDGDIRKKMKGSLSSKAYAGDASEPASSPIVGAPRYIEGIPGKAKSGGRTRIWEAWAARFALGVKAGLDAQRASDISLVARGIQMPETDDTVALIPRKEQVGVPLSRNAAISKRFKIFERDLDEVQSLCPTKPLVDLAEKALEKDKGWKSNLLGLPKGLVKLSSAEHMFETMLQDGIKVPMKVGDATGMRL